MPPPVNHMFEKNGITTVGGWLVIMILMFIPIVDLVLLAIWAFGSDNTDQSRKNWAMANLIVVAVVTVLLIIAVTMGMFI